MMKNENDGSAERCSFSRRDFVGLSAAGAAGFALSGAGMAEDKAAPGGKLDRSPDAVLARLIEGNKRFMKGEAKENRQTPAEIAAFVAGQAPSAVIIACADSRVPPELVFDQGIGDLFVVRVAGNLVVRSGPTVAGSIEYAVAELGTRLIMVMGHSKCGAVAAAVKHIDDKDKLPGAIEGLVDQIRPVVTQVGGGGEREVRLEKVIDANVLRCVAHLRTMEPIVGPAVKKGDVKVVGAIYQLSTGRLRLLENE